MPPEERMRTPDRTKVLRFWMIYGVDQRQPVVRYTIKRDADREATRLAIANPGIQFVVLQSVGGFVAQQPVLPLEIVDDGLPF